MNTITSPEKFYYDLQNSRFREHAFVQWEEYRRRVTDRILSRCDRDKTLALFGAGRCNDIDLKRLSEHFRQVTLIDINEEAMLAALKQYGLADSPKVRIAVKDFVGIEDEDYIRYLAVLQEDLLRGPHVPDEKDSLTLRQLDHMYEKAKKHMPHLGDKKYDYSLVLNVHSQLNDTADWIRTRLLTLHNAPISYETRLPIRILSETAGIVGRFNDALFQATKEKAFIGYELGLEGQPGEGIQGALQTYRDLRLRETKNRIRSMEQEVFTWPYDRSQKIVFSVLLETFSVFL